MHLSLMESHERCRAYSPTPVNDTSAPCPSLRLICLGPVTPNSKPQTPNLFNHGWTRMDTDRRRGGRSPNPRMSGRKKSQKSQKSQKNIDPFLCIERLCDVAGL